MSDAAAKAEILMVRHRFHEDIDIFALKHAEETCPGLAAVTSFEVDGRSNDQGDDVMKGDRAAASLQQVERAYPALIDDPGTVKQQLPHQSVLALEVVADGTNISLPGCGQDVADRNILDTTFAEEAAGDILEAITR